MEICPRDLSALEFRNRFAAGLVYRPVFNELPGIVRNWIHRRSRSTIECSECRAWWEATNPTEQYPGMPPQLFLQPQVVVPLVGPTASGKTHFMLACRWAIDQGQLGPLTNGLDDLANLGPAFRYLSPEVVDGVNIAAVAREFIVECRPVGATRPVRSGVEGDFVLPYHLVRSESRDGCPPYSLTMFDVAGEDWTNERRKIGEWGKGLARSSSMLWMLNLQTDSGSDPKFVRQFANLIRQWRGRGPGVLDLPVVVMVGRADELEEFKGLLDKVRECDKHLREVLNPSQLLGVRDGWFAEVSEYLSRSVEELSQQTVGHLRLMNRTDAVRAVLEHFEPGRVLFLPVSATGRPPGEDGTWRGSSGHQLEPVGCVTALTWLLYHLGSGGTG